jgi:hypothetical protein
MTIMAKKHVQLSIEPAVYAAWEALAHSQGKNIADFIVDATQKAVQAQALKNVPLELYTDTSAKPVGTINPDGTATFTEGRLTAPSADGSISGWDVNLPTETVIEPEQAETAWQREELAQPKPSVSNGRVKKS